MIKRDKIEKGNIKIAEFMDDSGEFARKRERAGCIEALNYHKSWDQLMTVVAKINQTNDIPLIIDGDSCWTPFRTISIGYEEDHGKVSSLIEAVWLSIVDVILQ